LIEFKPFNQYIMEGYIGEIRMFGGNYAPLNWHFCNGAILQIADFQALYSVIGTAYGGDGRSTLGLPDLGGTFPVGYGTNRSSGRQYIWGQRGGTESYHILETNLPPHNHEINAYSQNGNTADPTNAFMANTQGFDKEYASNIVPDTQMSSDAISLTGNGTPMSILPPYQTVSFIICLEGLYPSRS
jgi:microcystin-dependent protein